MKSVFVLPAAIFWSVLAFSQPDLKSKKYPALLWEITGNGLNKPSYLFGTMHVSSKLVFNLADSFYLGIRNANVVALETNPESWQEDMSKYDLSPNAYGNNFRYGNYDGLPNEYLNIHTLEFGRYEKRIEQALYSNPSVINNLLYRNYGESSADFEENTYLDMYIYQVGKKWGKRVAGVENYGESMKLMMEAYQDAAKDKNRKEKSYDNNGFSAEKLQEAYRTGNLDLLDSLNRLQSFSAAFDEKFLYRRNDIQAHSIDSILKSGSSLFVGVGAAHLPGNRGVIEILRRRGYRLRPVLMQRKNDGKQKETIGKINVPVSFTTYTSEDNFYKVDLPGKLFRSGEEYGMSDQQQYADMANGSYYIVTRLRTNNVMWGHTPEQVYQKIDSVLYENIPGRILVKKQIYKNGYRGFDIMNRTRRGDVQRYNIFVTPFELIFFKMSGNDEYVRTGLEAARFFGSIRLKEYGSDGGWKKYSPSFGGFSVNLPHQAFISNDGSWLFDAEDRTGSTRYRIVRTDIHNYHFAGEDTIDLNLMAESFKSSEFIDRETSRKFLSQNGYPALQCSYTGRNGSLFMTRFIIQGSHYYSLIAHAGRENPGINNFMGSFEIKPFRYGAVTARTDTSLYFGVASPVFSKIRKEKIEFGPGNPAYNADEEEPSDEKELLDKGVYRNKIIEDDSTGQKIYISFYKSGRYRFEKDSSRLHQKDFKSYLGGDSTWQIRDLKKELPGSQTRTWEYLLGKRGSSRIFRKKDFYKNGINYSVITERDTLTAPDAFEQHFFNSFTPADTLKGVNPFSKKSIYFFQDFFSTDSQLHKKALNSISEVDFDASDFQQLKLAINSLNWKQKKYLDTRKAFIAKLGEMRSRESADFLKDSYYAAADTVELQYAVLESLLRQQSSYAMNLFRDIILLEPPVLQAQNNPGWVNYRLPAPGYSGKYQISNGDFMDELYDSLRLTRTILPGLLPLLNLDDYKWPVMKLLATMIDSNLVRTKDYDAWFSKFLLEAKLELKKQVIAERKKEIRKAEDITTGKRATPNSLYDNDVETKDRGNEELSVYARLLFPFLEKNLPVQLLFRQLFTSSDIRLKYNTLLLCLRNNHPVPDTLAPFFASMDDYRYELYTDLQDAGKLSLFPGRYKNHLDLAMSKLRGVKEYDKPDSLLFIDSLPVTLRGQKGFVFFYRYKQKKDDDTWKLAYLGLVPENPALFELPDGAVSDDQDAEDAYLLNHFTEFTATLIKEEEALLPQLQETLRKIIYSTRPNAKEFYEIKDIEREEESSRRY